MNKFVLLFALVAAVVAEPPSNYGAPQQYSAPAQYSAPSSQGYSDFGGDSEDYVDDALLARIAQLIEQNSGSSSQGYSAPSSSYGAPSNSYGAPSNSYGAPTRGSSGGVILGRPEVAQRVAEFDLGSSSRSSGGYSQGGYN